MPRRGQRASWTGPQWRSPIFRKINCKQFQIVLTCKLSSAPGPLSVHQEQSGFELPQCDPNLCCFLTSVLKVGVSTGVEQGLAYSRSSLCVMSACPRPKELLLPCSTHFYVLLAFLKVLAWALIPVPRRDIWAGSSSPHSAIFRKDSGPDMRAATSFFLLLPARPAPLPASPLCSQLYGFSQQMGRILLPFT